jgi:excisionase family DNA binding protein
MATPANVESPAVPAVNPSAANPSSLLLNLSTAAPVVGLTVWQLRGLISSGELPVVKVGRKLYVRRATLLRWSERAEGRHRS